MLRSTKTKSLAWIVLIIFVLWLWRAYGPGLPVEVTLGDTGIAELYVQQKSGVMVEFEAQVERLLAEDKVGSPHQRFILALNNGHTLLVSHNLDLAKRVPLKVRDRVKVRGEYEYNEQGGVVHWTHRDPGVSGRHGWIELAGIRYE